MSWSQAQQAQQEQVVRERLVPMIAAPSIVDEKELCSIVAATAAECNGYVTYWDIEVSQAENFFDSAKSVLANLGEGEVDCQTLLTVARAIVAFYLDKERVREFPYINSWGKTVWHPNYFHIGCCEIKAGRLMQALGFLEEAESYFWKAAGYQDVAGSAREAMRKLAADYRQSGQQIPRLEKITNRLTADIVNHATRKALENIQQLSLSESYRWDDPLKDARKLISEMGYTETEQHQLLRPAYKAAIPHLIADRNKEIERLEQYGVMPEAVYHRSETLIEMHRLIGEKEGQLKWEMVFLVARRIDLEESISKSPERIKQLEGERDEYWLCKENEFHEKNIAELCEIKERIAQVEIEQTRIS